MRELELGWLSPTGELFPCYTYEHMDMARKIIDKYHYDDTKFRSHPDDCLSANGWVDISKSQFTHQFYIFWDNKIFLTDYQKNFLKDYFEDKEKVEGLSYRRWLEENGKYEYDEEGFRI